MDPISSPKLMLAPGTTLNSSSTISPSILVANLVKPTRQIPGDS
jgi:hypothetical protein